MLTIDQIKHAAWAAAEMPEAVAILRDVLLVEAGGGEEAAALAVVADRLKSDQVVKDEEGNDVAVVLPRSGHYVSAEDAPAVAAAALAGAVQLARMQGFILHPSRA